MSLEVVFFAALACSGIYAFVRIAKIYDEDRKYALADSKLAKTLESVQRIASELERSKNTNVSKQVQAASQSESSLFDVYMKLLRRSVPPQRALAVMGQLSMGASPISFGISPRNSLDICFWYSQKMDTAIWGALDDFRSVGFAERKAESYAGAFYFDAGKEGAILQKERVLVARDASSHGGMADLDSLSFGDARIKYSAPSQDSSEVIFGIRSAALGTT